MELVFDPSGHIRLPINDDEIVSRALAMQAQVGREVTLLTFDTGQSMRARAAGLTVRKLSKPLGIRERNWSGRPFAWCPVDG